MFQKGHLVRRIDPCWGEDEVALAAEADTFHWTTPRRKSGSSTRAQPIPRYLEPAAARSGALLKIIAIAKRGR
jgi:hypothetical protein